MVTQQSAEFKARYRHGLWASDAGLHSMSRLLIVSTVCALLTFFFLSMCIFTQEWTYAPTSKMPARRNGSREILPWSCIFDGSCKLKFWKMESEWVIACFVLMLLAWAIQFIGIILGITAMLLTKYRHVTVHLLSAAQIFVSVFLVVAFIIHGIEYFRNSKEHTIKAGDSFL
ncbi:unnamed protein product [Heligmosomoides polygyrus]|uniref:Uncharacterized protein n=1 Tax=Heligmosomoides polygyrus TaxID=6339 RepID=A0A183G8X5_HELPZ|nr:unnamed protein product [Heligmosomoides polygyrus]